MKNSRRNTISSNAADKDERETVHLFLFNIHRFHRFLKRPFTPASEIIIRSEPVMIRSVTGSENITAPRNIAKTIREEDIMEPAVALTHLYPVVIKN